MKNKASSPVPQARTGELLIIGREHVPYGRNMVSQSAKPELRHRLFVNDPWELIAEAIARSPKGKPREIAQSFRRQAEDYFYIATTGRELTVKPVLLYYAFLNLVKAYLIAKGNTNLIGQAYHGISCSPKIGVIPGTEIGFNKPGRSVFKAFLDDSGGNPAIINSKIKLGNVLPQILPGHRLWCYATTKKERFLSIGNSRLYHLPAEKKVWLNLYLEKEKLDRLGITENTLLSSASCKDFEIVVDPQARVGICLQQKKAAVYIITPEEALAEIINVAKNRIWETVRVGSPYRKQYIYFCPSNEQKARLPQMLSVYLLMFFLGSVTRYSPEYFESLLESKYGPFFSTFISESPMQFLYLMASDILGQEVSKPAII